MTITFALFLLCSLFLVWRNQSIDAAKLPQSRRVARDECFLWRTDTSNFIGGGRRVGYLKRVR